MKRALVATLLVIALSVLSSIGEARRKHKKKEPAPLTPFDVYKSGIKVGFFGFKTVQSATGKMFSSSKLEIRVKKGKLFVRTHTELDSSGKLIKFRKWIGKKYARPRIIAFWRKGALRIVSKGKSRFSKELSPKQQFFVLDEEGFHLFAPIARSFTEKNQIAVTCLIVDEGRLAEVKLTDAGRASFVMPPSKEIVSKVVRVHLENQIAVDVFLDEKGRFVGLESGDLLVVRKGLKLKERIPPKQGKNQQTEETKVEVVPKQPKNKADDKPSLEQPAKGETARQKNLPAKDAESGARNDTARDTGNSDSNAKNPTQKTKSKPEDGPIRNPLPPLPE